MTVTILFFIVFAYLLGSISSAIVVCKIAGLPDPRSTGSNNPGATNVLRIGGKKAAFFTLMGDALKGFLPVVIAKVCSLSEAAQAFVLFAAFLGHLYPVFFRFQGGKGVATTLGGLFALSSLLAGSWVVVWLTVAVFSRYSSLSALSATFLLPFLSWFVLHDQMVTVVLSLLSLLLIYRHQSNIKKLWLGQEKKF